jgi:hypothetical protein
MKYEKLPKSPGWIFFSTATNAKERRAELKPIMVLCKSTLGRSHGPHNQGSRWYYCHARSPNGWLNNRDSVVIVDPGMAAQVILTFF